MTENKCETLTYTHTPQWSFRPFTFVQKIKITWYYKLHKISKVILIQFYSLIFWAHSLGSIYKNSKGKLQLGFALKIKAVPKLIIILTINI